MKRRKKKAKKRFFLSFFVFIILIGTLIFYVLDFSKGNSYEVQKTINTKKTDYKHTLINNNIIILENNELTIHMENETNRHTFSGDFSETMLNKVGNMIFVTDIKKQKTYIAELSGDICNEIYFPQEILSIKQDSRGGYIGFHVREKDGTENLIFFDENGMETGSIKGIKDGSIVDYSIDSLENTVAISIITYEKGIKSNILFADIHGQVESGKIFENEIFPAVFLVENGELICVGDKRIIKMNKKKETVWEKRIVADRAEYSFFKKGLVICSSEIGKTNIILLGKDNEIILSESVTGSIKGIESSKSKTILYGDRSLYFVKNSSIEETKLTKDIVWAGLLSNGRVVIGSNNKIEILKDENFIN
jgi:hypothetical protein